jgi:Fe-S-cluster containining protein
VADADAYDPAVIDRAQAELRRVTGRSCGGCTACCRPFAIKAVEKPANVWCQHCKVGTGCKIYDTRPNACRGFACAWLFGAGELGDRPDELGVLWDTHELMQGCYIVRLIEVIPGALARLPREVVERVQGELVRFLARRGYTVLVEMLAVGAEHSTIVAPTLTPAQAEALLTYTEGGVDE